MLAEEQETESERDIPIFILFSNLVTLLITGLEGVGSQSSELLWGFSCSDPKKTSVWKCDWRVDSKSEKVHQTAVLFFDATVCLSVSIGIDR